VPIVPPSLKSARGKVLYSPHRQALLALLPLDRELVVLEAKRSSMWGEAEGWERVGSVEGGGGNEVLFDVSSGLSLGCPSAPGTEREEEVEDG
jgi:hypothetical protein